MPTHLMTHKTHVPVPWAPLEISEHHFKLHRMQNILVGPAQSTLLPPPPPPCVPLKAPNQSHMCVTPPGLPQNTLEPGGSLITAGRVFLFLMWTFYLAFLRLRSLPRGRRKDVVSAWTSSVEAWRAQGRAQKGWHRFQSSLVQKCKKCATCEFKRPPLRVSWNL